MSYGVVYCATNKVNGKKYVGQSTDFDHRKKNHLYGHCPGCRAFYNAIKKYGPDSFDWSVVAHAACQETLDLLEIVWIQAENSLSPNGYNLRTGGSGGGKASSETRQLQSDIATRHYRSLSEEDKERRAEQCRGRKSPMKGKAFSDEVRQRMSEGGKGRIPWNKGTTGLCKAWNKGTKGVCVPWNKGIPMSEEQRAKCSKAQKARFAKKKEVN